VIEIGQCLHPREEGVLDRWSFLLYLKDAIGLIAAGLTEQPLYNKVGKG
jgi:hypothetical protein